MEDLMPMVAVVSIFIGMPWLFLHYLTKLRQAKSITVEDEDLLDELHDIARRLDERLHSIERIIAADHADDGQAGSPKAGGRIELGRPNENPLIELRSASRNRD